MADDTSAREQAYDVFGLDAFQRIAVDYLSDGLDLGTSLPRPGSVEEQRLIAIGRVVGLPRPLWLDPPAPDVVT